MSSHEQFNDSDAERRHQSNAEHSVIYRQCYLMLCYALPVSLGHNITAGDDRIFF